MAFLHIKNDKHNETTKEKITKKSKRAHRVVEGVRLIGSHVRKHVILSVIALTRLHHRGQLLLILRRNQLSQAQRQGSPGQDAVLRVSVADAGGT